MSSNWPQVTLKDVTSILGDGLHGTPEYDNSGEYYFINGNNLNNGNIIITEKTKRASKSEYEKHKKDLNDRTILVSINGTLGNIAFYNGEKVFLGKSACYFNVKPDVDKHYIRYVLESGLFQNYIHNLATGSTIKNVSLKLMRDFSFKLPPKGIQKNISRVLKDLDDKIQTNIQTNQTLEQIAQAIFKSWFVDFGPVKAKIAVLEAGGTTEQAELAAMSAISAKDEAALKQLQTEQPAAYAELAQTAALFPSKMVDSELGEIPEGWEIGKLANIIDFNPRRSLKKGTLAPYLDMKNVPTTGHLAIEIVDREMASGTKFVNGDTLLARITPCLENGKTAYVDFLKDNQVGWGSTEYIVMRPQEDYPTSIGYLLARDTNFRQQAIQSMTGTSGRQRADAKALAETAWLIYPKELVKAFDKTAKRYLSLAKINGDESKSLSEIRDALLPKLLSGELIGE